MKLSAQFPSAAARDRVYAALIDPVVLQRCIPGCERLAPAGDHRYDATVKIGVAGLKGTYTGRAELRDARPPDGFTLVLDGKGAPGFVRAVANIALSEAATGTSIACDADVQVGGLIAAVGSRLIEAVARTQMADFFGRLEAEIASSASSEKEPST